MDIYTQPRKPLFNKEEGAVFISYIDDDTEKRIAKLIFVDGLTALETALEVNYSKRQIERYRTFCLKLVLKKLIKKELSKKRKRDFSV